MNIFSCGSGFRQFLLDMQRLLMPTTCAACGAPLLDVEAGVCMHCIGLLPATTFEHEADNRMMERLAGIVPIERAFAGFYFRKEDMLRDLVHSFKYNGQRSVAIGLGRELGRRALEADFCKGFDTLVPVPINNKRRRERGYNQAEMVARGFGEITGLRVSTKVLLRAGSHSSQTHLGAAERLKNVQGDFYLGPEAEAMEGRGIILVDDVFTTGATSESCLSALWGIENVRLGVVTVGVVGE